MGYALKSVGEVVWKCFFVSFGSIQGGFRKEKTNKKVIKNIKTYMKPVLKPFESRLTLFKILLTGAKVQGITTVTEWSICNSGEVF